MATVMATKKVQSQESTKVQDSQTRAMAQTGERMEIAGVTHSREPKQLLDALDVDAQRKVDYQKALQKIQAVRNVIRKPGSTITNDPFRCGQGLETVDMSSMNLTAVEASAIAGAAPTLVVRASTRWQCVQRAAISSRADALEKSTTIRYLNLYGTSLLYRLSNTKLARISPNAHLKTSIHDADDANRQ